MTKALLTGRGTSILTEDRRSSLQWSPSNMAMQSCSRKSSLVPCTLNPFWLKPGYCNQSRCLHTACIDALVQHTACEKLFPMMTWKSFPSRIIDLSACRRGINTLALPLQVMAILLFQRGRQNKYHPYGPTGWTE